MRVGIKAVPYKASVYAVVYFHTACVHLAIQLLKKGSGTQPVHTATLLMPNLPVSFNSCIIANLSSHNLHYFTIIKLSVPAVPLLFPFLSRFAPLK